MASYAAGDRTVKFWEVATGRETRTLTGHQGRVYAVAYSLDGRLLASGSSDRTIRLWDTATGQESATLAGHSDAIHALAFSPNQRWLASVSGDSGNWDLTTTPSNLGCHVAPLVRTVGRHDEWVSGVAFDPHGDSLVSASRNRIKVWDTNTWIELRTLEADAPFALSPDGELLACRGGRR